MWSETSCWRSACHKDPQCTRSKAFDKSKLTIHTGLPVATVLLIKLAVSKCSSMHGNRVVPQVVLCQVVFQSVQGSYKQMSCKAAAKKQQAGNLWVAKHV